MNLPLGVALGEQAHDRAGQDGLAGAGLAHDAQRLAAVEGEADAVDRTHEAAVGSEVGVEIADLEERAVGLTTDACSWRLIRLPHDG
jgi:hypothetical protein